MEKNFHRFRHERCPTAPAPSGYLESFPTQESQFRPSLRYINPDLGYEAPFHAGRATLEKASGRATSIDDGCVGRHPESMLSSMNPVNLHIGKACYHLCQQRWRPHSRHIDPGSGSLSEKPFKPCVKMVTGPEDNKTTEWKSSMHAVTHVDESSGQPGWKSTRHRPSTFSEWYLDESGRREWRSSRKSATYTHQPEWIPPFREYEGKVPKRFYSIVPPESTGAAGERKKGGQTGKRKSKLYNQFATTFDKNFHYDEFKKPLGGIKTTYQKSNDNHWPFTPLPPTRNKKKFDDHNCHKEGVSMLLNPAKDKQHDSYIFL